MDRRKFLKVSAAAVAAVEAGQFSALAAKAPRKTRKNADEAKPEFEKVTPTCENVPAGQDDLALRFLGTGAAGWFKDHTRRRHSSVLLDGKVLIDLTESALETLPEGCRPEVVFFTHSHGDHYSPKVTMELGVKRVYLSESWIARARKDFAKVAAETGLPVPEITPLKVGERTVEQGLTLLALPGNHATSDLSEQALIYVIEKGTTEENLGVRVLYATDTGGLMGIATRLAGIDSHLKPGRPITGFIMEATVGIGMEEDYRIFNHSSVDMVTKAIHMLQRTGRYTPPAGQPAYTTHMSRAGWPEHEQLEALMPAPLRPAYDGLEVVFRPLD